MTKRLNCHCRKTPGCKLCNGTGQYDYEVGPAGYQPFRCPSCEGTRTVAEEGAPDRRRPCPTCAGQGIIDPANPPVGEGLWDKLMKIFFGA